MGNFDCVSEYVKITTPLILQFLTRTTAAAAILVLLARMIADAVDTQNGSYSCISSSSSSLDALTPLPSFNTFISALLLAALPPCVIITYAANATSTSVFLVEGGRRLDTRVTWSDPEEVERIRFVVVGIDPLWVFRQADYDMIAHWEHKLPAAATTDETEPAPARKPATDAEQEPSHGDD